MNKEEFVLGIKKYVVKGNHDLVLRNLESPIPDRATNENYINMIRLFQNMNSSEQDIIREFLRLIIENDAASFLAILDGVSDIGQQGDFQLNYLEHGTLQQLNEDKGKYLIDIFWETE